METKSMIKRIIIYSAWLLFFAACVSCQKAKSEIIKVKAERIIEHKKSIDYTSYFDEAQEYCNKNNLNEELFFLIDLGIHSGLKRFFIYDLKDKKLLKSFLVSHGCGNSVWGETFTKEDAKVSNQFDSHCSSIGKYIVLNRGVSQWGIKVNYVLDGKEDTNSNALNRAIVLHSWEEVPNGEVYPDGTPEGWGCPAVSNESMIEIDSILQKNKKVLFWVIKTLR